MEKYKQLTDNYFGFELLRLWNEHYGIKENKDFGKK